MDELACEPPPRLYPMHLSRLSPEHASTSQAAQDGIASTSTEEEGGRDAAATASIRPSKTVRNRQQRVSRQDEASAPPRRRTTEGFGVGWATTGHTDNPFPIPQKRSICGILDERMRSRTCPTTRRWTSIPLPVTNAESDMCHG
ncbi:hypothetical protein C8Q76DRAFT_103611 [Earliella scabrosa]|nr:hypothetical protein C8Q76DRAFT_103611 [Earliella scabrosa]